MNLTTSELECRIATLLDVNIYVYTYTQLMNKEGVHYYTQLETLPTSIDSLLQGCTLTGLYHYKTPHMCPTVKKISNSI